MEIYLANLSAGTCEDDLLRSFSYIRKPITIEIVKADGISRNKDFAILHIKQAKPKTRGLQRLNNSTTSVAL